MNLDDLSTPIFGASTIQSTGLVIGAFIFVGFAIYVGFNILAGRREVGSEVELAPNRRPYMDDEELETTRLTRTLAAGLGLLLIIAIGLPLYWLAEPGRQDGAVEMFDETFISRGADQFEEGSGCADCHGPEGSGGVATYTLFNDAEEYVATVNWAAPAIDSAPLRFSDDELYEIIEYGRPGTPMQGWGEGGQGPLTSQQIDELVIYLNSLTPGYEEVQESVEEELDDRLPANADTLAMGEAIFNMDGVAGDAYACARCHTAGFSVDTEAVADEREPMMPWPDWVHSAPGSGSFGPALRDMVPTEFATVDELAEFVAMGDTDGEGYGRTGLGSGRMPAFGDNPNTDAEHDGMFTREMVCAVALYVSNLDGDGEPTLGVDFSGVSGDYCSDDYDQVQAEAQADAGDEDAEDEESEE